MSPHKYVNFHLSTFSLKSMVLRKRVRVLLVVPGIFQSTTWRFTFSILLQRLVVSASSPPSRFTDAKALVSRNYQVLKKQKALLLRSYLYSSCINKMLEAQAQWMSSIFFRHFLDSVFRHVAFVCIHQLLGQFLKLVIFGSISQTCNWMNIYIYICVGNFICRTLQCCWRTVSLVEGWSWGGS